MRRILPRSITGLLAAASIFFFATQLPALVVINEIGYYIDPRGDTGKEWIELFNPDTVAVDLSEYQLHLGRSPRYTFPREYTLGPGSFVLVHLRAAGQNTATDLFEGTAPANNMPNTQGSVVLFTNAYPAVIADFMQYGAASQTWESDAVQDGLWIAGTYVDTALCGHSLGLSSNGVDSNRATDWTEFARPTPGYSNNPPTYDVAIAGVTTDPRPVAAGQPFTVIADIANRGSHTARQVSVVVFNDDNGDSLPGVGERIYSQAALDTLSAAVLVRCPLPGMGEGAYAFAVAATCSSDAFSWDGFARLSLTAGSPVVINEIQYDPQPGLAEWIELYNRSGSPVDLHRFTIEDLSAAARAIDTAHTIVPARGYAVLTSLANQPAVTGPLLKPVGGWPSLGNEDDIVCLRDANGNAIDLVHYDKDWGGSKGVSLERINPFLNSQDRANWGGCVAPFASTPGARNSLYQEKPAAGSALELSPNPFSPDRDGFEDNLIISLKLDWPQAAVTVRVYDRLGRLVRTLAQDKPMASNSDIIWDGTSDQGAVCPIGLYVISLEARDITGGAAVKKSKVVAIARKL
jgi:hypothetical protein